LLGVEKDREDRQQAKDRQERQQDRIDRIDSKQRIDSKRMATMHLVVAVSY